jgi:16S rRNA processing protein RimM
MRLEIGYVARAHGVQGEVRVHLHDAASETLLEVERAWFAGVPLQIESARPTKGAVLLGLEGVHDRDAAEKLKGAKVEVLRTDVPLAEGEFFVADLVGCDVFDEHGASLGKIVEIIPSAQDLMVIRDATSERILPVVPEFVRVVDIAARRVDVALPEGLPVEPIR